jgi:hypothetical protein
VIVIVGSILLGAVILVGAFVGFVSFAFQPSRVDVVTLENPSCVISGGQFVVTATIGRGPDYDASFFVGLRGWDDEAVEFHSSLADDADSLVPGDHIAVSGPVARAPEIRGIDMDIWRGEPGYAQTVPLSLEIDGADCAVTGN